MAEKHFLAVCRTDGKSTARQGSGPKHPDLSLHSHHYVPQYHAIFASLSRLLATTPLSPAGLVVGETRGIAGRW